jgi:hypothetical protein
MAENLNKVISVFFHEKYCILRPVFPGDGTRTACLSPGQMWSLPERLVVEGPYQWVRHPIYLSHFLLIGGAALACRALMVALETPIVLGMAAIGGKYEESSRLLPLFGRTFEQYKAKTHFLLPAWGWVALGFIYSLIAFRVFFLEQVRCRSSTAFYPS